MIWIPGVRLTVALGEEIAGRPHGDTFVVGGVPVWNHVGSLTQPLRC